MFLSSVLIIGTLFSVSNALAHDGPQSTALADSHSLDWQGWSPAPTTAPKIPYDLLRRHLEGREVGTTILVGADATCGYLSGSPGAPYGCGELATCKFFPSLGALACCAPGQDCRVNLACVNSKEFYSSTVCGDVCKANVFTRKCTALTAPYCNTVSFPDVSATDYYCYSSSVTGIQTVRTNYAGQTYGGVFSPSVLADTATISNSKTSSSQTTSTSSTTSQSSTSPTLPPTTPPQTSKSVPIGPIVGGAVGGVAVLALIGFGIFFLLRKNRNKAAANNQAQAQTQPPTYGYGEAGSYDTSKTAMQMNQQELHNSSYSPGPAGGYSPQLNRDSGIGSPDFGGSRTQTTSPSSPQFGSESHMSMPVYEPYVSPNPQIYHEVSGKPIGS